MIKFKPNPGFPNQLLKGKGFYLSYNPATGAGNPTAILLSSLLGQENGKEETALRNESTGIWYILNGDFRKQYEEVVSNGFDACLAVYKENIQHRSEWSTD